MRHDIGAPVVPPAPEQAEQPGRTGTDHPNADHPGGQGGLFASLRFPDFRSFVIGATATNVGTWMHRVAQAWLILELTGDATVLGFALALQFAPMLLLGPWAGVLADKFDRRALLAGTQVAMALQAAGLAAVVLHGSATEVVILASAALLGVASALEAPARQSIVSDLVPHGSLVNAVSLNNASFNGARLIGPAAAGAIIAAWGAGWVFAVNAATFAVMLVCLMLLPAPRNPRARGRGGVMEGVREVARRPDLAFVILVAGAVSCFVLNFQLTIPVMATQQFDVGPAAFGWLGAAMAVGSILGALWTARRGRTSLRMVWTAGAGLGAAATVAGLMPSAWLFALSLTVCGGLALTMMTGAASYLQTRTDPGIRGRLMALYLAVFFGTTPFGAPVIGLLADTAGPRAALIVPGLAALVSVGALLLGYRRKLCGHGIVV